MTTLFIKLNQHNCMLSFQFEISITKRFIINSRPQLPIISEKENVDNHPTQGGHTANLWHVGDAYPNIKMKNLNHLIQTSDSVIKNVEKYLIDNNIKSTNQEEILDIQTFSINNKQYYLDNEKIILDIYHIISNTKHFSHLEKKINIENTILFDINNILQKLAEKNNNSIIRSMSLYNIREFIEYTLSDIIAKSFLTEKVRYFGKYRTAFIAQLFGKSLLEAFFIRIIKNYISNNIVKERDITDLRSYLGYLKSNSTNYLKIIPYNLDIESKKAIIDYLESYILFIDMKNSDTNNDNEKYISLHKKKIVHEMNLGLILINELVDNKIFTEITNKRKVPFLEFNEKLAIELATSSSYYKPWLSTKEPSLIYKHENGNINMSMHLLYDPIPNKSYIKISPTDLFKGIIKNINSTPYQINSAQVNEFMNLLIVLQESTDIENNILIIKSLYHLDFHDFIINNTNKCLVHSLINFAKDFTRILDNDLREKCNNNLACIKAYNIIISQKYFIIGLINDLNIYKHFNYFYIPRYLSSTGRTYSMPYYLQLQNNKLPRAFIMFKFNKNRSINIENRNKILLKHLPKIHQYKDEQEYKDNIYNMFKQYILSFCKPDVNINSYPYETNNILDQLNWLGKYTKKHKDILYLKTLFHSLKNNTYFNQMFQKDATSNGLQIIAMITGDTDLCTKTNIIGVEPVDIYSLALDIFINNMKQLRDILDSFFNEIFDKSYDDFLNQGFLNATENLIDQLLNNKQFDLMLYQELESVMTITLKKRISKYKVTFTKVTLYKLDQSFKGDNMKKVIGYLHNFHQNIKAYNSLPKELISRNLYKKVTMAFGYSQGWKSRQQSFLDQIQKYYQEKGYNKVLIETDIIINLISKNFALFAKSNLNKVSRFLKITKIYVKTKNINISLKYLKWTMNIIPKTISRKRFYKDKEGRKVIIGRFTIHNKKAIAEKKVGKTFPAIFIQGIEAHIFYEIINKVCQLNEDLRQQNLPEICMTSIHDCTMTDTSYADCLLEIAQHSYNSINNLEFPQMQNFGKNKNYEIICSNPYVIKH